MPGQFQSTIAVHHSHRESELVHLGHETASLPPTQLVWPRLGPFSVGAVLSAPGARVPNCLTPFHPLATN